MDDSVEVATVQEFVNKFETAVPGFGLLFPGQLQAAIDTCWNPRTKKRKLLALCVLNADFSDMAEFGSKLCSVRIKTILEESYVVWGWNICTTKGKHQFVTLITHKLGKAGEDIVSAINEGPFPKIFVLDKPKSGNFMLIHQLNDNATEDELFMELESVCWPLVRKSLDLLEPLNISKTVATSSAQLPSHGRGSINSHRKKSRQLTITDLGIPPEPAPEDPKAINITFAVDNKTVWTRRFAEEDTVEMVINYLISCDYTLESYKFVGKKSRTDFGNVSPTVTLKALSIRKVEHIAIEKTDLHE